MTAQYANRLGYSDVKPCEIIRHVSAKTIEIRDMRSERDPTWKPEIIPGGFAGHCVNQHTQRWNITSDPEGRVTRIRLNNRGVWKDSHGRKYQLSDTPRRFYDYNF